MSTQALNLALLCIKIMYVILNFPNILLFLCLSRLWAFFSITALTARLQTLVLAKAFFCAGNVYGHVRVAGCWCSNAMCASVQIFVSVLLPQYSHARQTCCPTAQLCLISPGYQQKIYSSAKRTKTMQKCSRAMNLGGTDRAKFCLRFMQTRLNNASQHTSFHRNPASKAKWKKWTFANTVLQYKKPFVDWLCTKKIWQKLPYGHAALTRFLSSAGLVPLERYLVCPKLAARISDKEKQCDPYLFCQVVCILIGCTADFQYLTCSWSSLSSGGRFFYQILVAFKLVLAGTIKNYRHFLTPLFTRLLSWLTPFLTRSPGQWGS